MRIPPHLAVAVVVAALASLGCAAQTGSGESTGTTRSRETPATTGASILDAATGNTRVTVDVGIVADPVWRPISFSASVFDSDGSSSRLINVSGLVAVGPGGGCIAADVPGLAAGEKIVIDTSATSADGTITQTFSITLTVAAT